MDVIETVKSVLPHVLVLTFGIIGTIITHFLFIPRIEKFLKRRRERRLEEDKNAKEAFEKVVEYYLDRPDGGTEGLLFMIFWRLAYLGTFIIFTISFLVFIIGFSFESSLLVFIGLLSFGVSIVAMLISKKQENLRSDIWYEVKKRQRENPRPPQQR